MELGNIARVPRELFPNQTIATVAADSAPVPDSQPVPVSSRPILLAPVSGSSRGFFAVVVVALVIWAIARR